MALTINTNIKNDADGYLVDASGVKVSGGLMLDTIINLLMNTTIPNLEEGLNARYTKPTSGIPAADLASAVQTALNRADTLTDDYINNLIDTKLGVIENGNY